MSAPLISTKLFMPPLRKQAVLRRRLIDRLNAGLSEGTSLTLVSASAGFGKTTLLSEWIVGIKRRDPNLGIAWLSLDEGDSDPSRFLSYLVAALRCVEPGIGTDAMAALQSPMPPSAESILVELINEVEDLRKDIILVLDDYHAVDSPQVDTILAFLIGNIPAHMHLAIASREDPDFPLARLRTQGGLLELRAADLRFTPGEAAEYLGVSLGIGLATEEIEALETRTEGWIAGLQLAALSMRGHKDRSGFIRSFTGSHRYVLDYLADEVLHREPESTQAFLLCTSVLDRLCGPLCDALLETSSAQETLEYLERANLFIVPLDGERKWYRYHRLFREFLSHRLEQNRTGDGMDTDRLRIRASLWHEANGLYIDAFRYATAAGDLDRAQGLIARGTLPKHSREAVIAILDWLSSLPAATLDDRPALRVLKAGMSLVAGQPKCVEEELATAERIVVRNGPGDKNNDLLGRIATARAALAVFRYQPDEIMAQSNRALELLALDNFSSRMTANWTTIVAEVFRENRAVVGKRLLELESMAIATGDIYFLQVALNGLGESQIKDNLLHEAAETFTRALRVFGEHPQPNANQAHLGLARIHYEWNELDAAEEEAERSLRIARLYDESVDRFILCELLLARIKIARGLSAAATAKLGELAVKAQSPRFRHRLPEIAKVQVSAFLRKGDVEAATRLAGSYKLPLAQARVFLARNEPDQALALIEPYVTSMEAKGWNDEYLTALMLHALAIQGKRPMDEACFLLGQAMELAEPGGFIRLFLDEGEPMERLLVLASAKGKQPAYADRLLADFVLERKAREEAGAGSSASRSQGLIDPLSQRELEVLRLIAQGLSNQEIGERLFLALDTIKGHNRRIFDKLDVKRRTEALARARGLGLL
jgi:LuxR family maltose regulon positive regulatory protein